MKILTRWWVLSAGLALIVIAGILFFTLPPNILPWSSGYQIIGREYDEVVSPRIVNGELYYIGRRQQTNRWLVGGGKVVALPSTEQMGDIPSSAAVVQQQQILAGVRKLKERKYEKNSPYPSGEFTYRGKTYGQKYDRVYGRTLTMINGRLTFMAEVIPGRFVVFHDPEEILLFSDGQSGIPVLGDSLTRYYIEPVWPDPSDHSRFIFPDDPQLMNKVGDALGSEDYSFAGLVKKNGKLAYKVQELGKEKSYIRYGDTVVGPSKNQWYNSASWHPTAPFLLGDKLAFLMVHEGFMTMGPDRSYLVVEK